MKEKSFIISISSNSGGGKTTITRELCNQLSNAKALYFDNYDYTKQPENICEWVENGSDPSEWDLSLLVNHIMNIIKSENVAYIILDYPKMFSSTKSIDKNKSLRNLLEISTKGGHLGFP